LHLARIRRQAVEETEAAGVNLWGAEFEAAALVRIEAGFRSHWTTQHLSSVARRVRSRFERELGITLRGGGWDQIAGVLLTTYPYDGPSLIPSMIEALAQVAEDGHLNDQINGVLREHRISFELVEDQMIEFESKELHENVVVPTLRLLAGRKDWESVEGAYQKALEEVSRGDPSDAITDAGTALQETLVALGCEGKSLGPLLKSARSKGLLAPHDASLEKAIDGLVTWVSADRSEKGDSHKGASGASREDGWLTIHVVGALILRLVSGDERTT
jgi:hypothetical protein